MKALILAAIAVVGWATIAEAGYKKIALTDVPAAEMKAATDAVAGFAASSAMSDDADCTVDGDCGLSYAITGKAKGVGVVVFVSSDPDGTQVDRIDTEVDLKTVPPPVLKTMAKQKKFRPAALFLSRREIDEVYLFVGAPGSVPASIEINPDGSIVSQAKKKK